MIKTHVLNGSKRNTKMGFKTKRKLVFKICFTLKISFSSKIVYKLIYERFCLLRDSVGDQRPVGRDRDQVATQKYFLGRLIWVVTYFGRNLKFFKVATEIGRDLNNFRVATELDRDRVKFLGRDRKRSRPKFATRPTRKEI